MINKMLFSRCLPVFLTAVLISSCARGPIPKDHFYRLDVDTSQLAPAILDGTLEIHKFSADDLTRGRALVYAEPGPTNELKSYHYHFWVESPTSMVQQQLVRYLRSAGVANSITTPQLRTSTDYDVNGRILRLERIVGSTPSARLALELIVKHNKSNQPVMSRTYQATVPAGNKTVASTVKAMNQALTGIFSRFLQDLSELQTSLNSKKAL